MIELVEVEVESALRRRDAEKLQFSEKQMTVQQEKCVAFSSDLW